MWNPDRVIQVLRHIKNLPLQAMLLTKAYFDNRRGFDNLLGRMRSQLWAQNLRYSIESLKLHAVPHLDSENLLISIPPQMRDTLRAILPPMDQEKEPEMGVGDDPPDGNPMQPYLDYLDAQDKAQEAKEIRIAEQWGAHTSSVACSRSVYDRVIQMYVEDNNSDFRRDIRGALADTDANEGLPPDQAKRLLYQKALVELATLSSGLSQKRVWKGDHATENEPRPYELAAVNSSLGFRDGELTGGWEAWFYPSDVEQGEGGVDDLRFHRDHTSMARQGNKIVMTMGDRHSSAIYAADGIGSRFAALFPVKGGNFKTYFRENHHDVALEIHASQSNDIRVTVGIDGDTVEFSGRLKPVDDEGECYILEDRPSALLSSFVGLVEVIWPDGTIELWDQNQLMGLMAISGREKIEWLAEELARRGGGRR